MENLRPVRTIVAAMMAIGLCGSPLFAQPEIGSLVNRDRGAVGYLENVDRANSAQVMNAFAQCFARQRERASEAIVQLPYFSEEQGAATRRLISSYERCLGDNEVQLRFPVQLLVGGMAEYFILRRYEGVDISALTALDDAAIMRAGLSGRNGYENLAVCVVRRDPASARALVATAPRTEAERTVIARLVPHLAPCVPADFTMSFDRGSLRALMAIGVYRAVVMLAGAAR